MLVGPEEQRGCFSAFGGVGAAFGVVIEWIILLFPRSPLPTPKCRRFAAVGSGTRLRAQSLSAAGR